MPQERGVSEIHAKRRMLLKFALVGGGAFILGKILGSRIPFFSDNRVIGTKEFENFNIVETNKTLKVSGKDGEAIMIFEKD